jgi:hypothetical protein
VAGNVWGRIIHAWPEAHLIGKAATPERLARPRACGNLGRRRQWQHPGVSEEAADRRAGHRRGGGPHQLHDHSRRHRHPLGGGRDLMRPTASLSLYLQMVGRVSRTGEAGGGDPRSRG